MKFAEIIRNTGLDVARFPNCANILIHLYDGKDRVSTEEIVKYTRPLFTENGTSLEKFHKALTQIEREDITSMNVKVDENAVVLFYKTPRAIIFLRKMFINPLDYMD